MPINFAKPVTTDNYSTGLLPGLVATQTALARLLDTSLETDAGLTNKPTGIKRYNASSQLFEQWSGSAWGPMPLAYGPNAAATTGAAGMMSATDKTKLDGVQAGAQVNTVTSVFGRTGAVGLASADVTGALGFAPANVAGQSFGGPIFGSGGVGDFSAETGQMGVRSSSSNAAVISFHRQGAYAINVGLDTSNVFKVGGWSDGASTFRFWSDASGNLTSRGLLYGRGGGAGLGQITVSISGPSGGADGDLWFQH
ncbi:MAG: hypothetical protein RR101_13485 [Burkholderiaceae bacterium]